MNPDELLALLRRAARDQLMIDNLAEQNALLREKVRELEARAVKEVDEPSNVG